MDGRCGEAAGLLLQQDRAQTAIAVALDVGFHAGRTGQLVGAAEVAERLGVSRRGLEPVLQALSRAGLLDSLRGPRGGYRLARRPRDIVLREVIAAVAEAAPEGSPRGSPRGTPEAGLVGKLQAAVVAPLWQELDALVGERLAALTLDHLLRRAAAAGLRRPVAEPVNFVI